jgi:hypothetical protein
MTEDYQLTHDDSKAPRHYGWKTDARLEAIESALAAAKARRPAPAAPAPSEDDIRKIVRTLDAQGRWLSAYEGQMLVGQPKFKPGQEYLASAVFAQNLEALSDYVARAR